MKDQLMTFLKKSWVMPTGVGVVSFGGGLAAGYFLARHRMKSMQVNNEPVQLTLNFDSNMYADTGKKIQTESLKSEHVPKSRLVQEKIVRLEDLDKETYPYVSTVYETTEEIEVEVDIPESEPGEEQDAVVVNIFARSDTEWDYETELESRSPDHPYIIHKDEFFSDEMGWDTQMTLTWYEGDQILCDEQDVPIYNPPGIVGNLRFGHGSGDPNVVYVRNEKLKAEYEVLRDPGSYEIDVLGGHVEKELFETDLKHSRQPGKFREA